MAFMLLGCAVIRDRSPTLAGDRLAGWLAGHHAVLLDRVGLL
jgi:hypothetical protein